MRSNIRNDQADQLAIDIVNLVESLPSQQVKNEMINGLKSAPKFISSKYFYDHYGSELFERITRLDEYYPTRTEKSILERIAPGIAENPGIKSIIELGSGDCSKSCMLFEAYPQQELSKLTYYPVDVSSSALRESSELLNQRYPELNITGYVADFVEHIEVLPGESGRLISFFGSTIGNLSRDMAKQFLRQLSEKMDAGDHLLVGFDLVKDRDVLEKAYNDEEGVTEEFNRNILRVVNRTLEANFSLKDFAHLAFYDEEMERIEMHLEAIRDIEVHSPIVPSGIYLRKGETIHTENSHKFSTRRIRQLADHAGLKINHMHTDDQNWFALVHFEKDL